MIIESTNSISVPRYIINNRTLGDYRILAYVFMKEVSTKRGIVYFRLQDYLYFASGGTTKNTRDKLVKMKQSLQNVISLLTDSKKNYLAIYNCEANIDIMNSKPKDFISFVSKDVYLNIINGDESGYTIVDINDIYSMSCCVKECKKDSVPFYKIVNTYLYLMENMSYPKQKNEDGTYHYSNNPIYFMCYKSVLSNKTGIKSTSLANTLKLLFKLNLIREYHPVGNCSYIENDMITNNMPTMFFPYKCEFIPNYNWLDNFKLAAQKFCKEKEINYKEYMSKYNAVIKKLKQSKQTENHKNNSTSSLKDNQNVEPTEEN